MFEKIFGSKINKSVIKRLEKRVEELQDLLKEQEINKIDYRTDCIKECTARSIELERTKARFELEEQNLKSELEKIKLDTHFEQKALIEDLTLEHSIELREQADQIENGYKKEIMTANNEAIAEKKNASKFEGLYSGTLLVIKSLETQVKELTTLNATLIKALPGVDVKVTSPTNVDNSTTVHAK